MYFLNLFLFAAAYFLAEKFSLLFNIPLGFPSPIHFTSGIALAGILIGGYRYLPGIIIGGLTSHLTTLIHTGENTVEVVSFLVPFLLALSTLLQVTLSAFFIKRKVPFFNRLEKGKDIFIVLLIGGPLGCIVNATLRPFILSLKQELILNNSYFFNWSTWWIEDLIGVLLILPLILFLKMPKITMKRKATIGPLVLILFTAVITLFFYERRLEENSVKKEFTKIALEKVNRIKERILIYDKVLKSIQYFYAASQFVDRDEFREFVEGMYVQYKGIQALKWIPRVLHKDKKEYEQRVQKDGFPDFRFTQKGNNEQSIFVEKRKEYFPIYYVEPYEKNKKTFGFDLGSIPKRLKTMQKARDLGISIATEPIRLLSPHEENNNHQMGFLVFHPIYEMKKNSKIQSNIQSEHRNELKGFALGLFHINDLIHQEMNPLKVKTMSLYVYDKETNEKKTVLYGIKNKKALFSSQTPLNVASRKWILEFTPTHHFFLQQKYGWKSWSVILLGLFLISLFQIFLLVMTNRSETVKSLVNEQTLKIRQSKNDLEQAVEKLTQSNAELERFAYIASHDLQEPLRMIINFTALLKKEYGEKLDQQALKYMKFSTHSARRMQALINDLLEYSRVGREAERRTHVDCEKVMQSTLDSLSESIINHKAKITYDKMPIVPGNPIRMLRLFQNLIGNSIKYTDSNNIPVIHIGIEEKEFEWLFSIKDNGIGMKEDYLETIFMPFKRLHSQNQYTGTGIGLAICKKIVESFEGRIWADSKPGAGSTFYFTIPKKKKQNQETLNYA